MCSESRALQLQSGGSEPPTREIESISHVGGYAPPDTDFKYIVGFCEQTSKVDRRGSKKQCVQNDELYNLYFQF